MAVEVDFQTAIYGALTGDAPLMAMVNAVYSKKPQADDGGSDSPFPYIVMRFFYGENDTKTENGFNVLMRLHTWGRTGSDKEVKQIQGLIYTVLHKNEPSVTGHTVISLTREGSDVIDDDGTIHGVCDYRALIETN